jgi:hypothetical protein
MADGQQGSGDRSLGLELGGAEGPVGPLRGKEEGIAEWGNCTGRPRAGVGAS